MPPKTRTSTNSRDKRPFVFALAGLVLVAIIAVVAIVVAGGGSSTAVSAAPAAYLKDIPQQGFVLGDPSAPVKLVMYIEPQCPHCAAMETTVFPQLVADYVKPGKVSVEAHVLSFIGPDSEPAARYMNAAAEQNRYWNYAAILYHHQGTENTGWVTDKLLNDVAGAAGLDAAKAKTTADAAATSKAIKAETDAATKAGVGGTPWFLIGPVAGEQTVFQQQSDDDYATFKQRLDDELAAAGK